ncbi:DUF3993 domain-containing protein [Cytobacillus gottheilii]|uniref:DUF3993 domain-containing protein n=2 Tax=Cytobacillus gottheilii TaxID=859144 RepID=A0ABX8FGF2_9BACI|nr:DUF3993 domain-containing protein [Cytobacillus gottheilii]QVY63108.1 DUF3993 domain-containing protein [Cytobacillus gottheilii]
MMYRLGKSLCICLLLCLSMFSMTAYANTDREEVFKHLQNAFEAQISLGGEERSLEEVRAILAPYFTQSAEKLFLDENLYEENDLYFTLGTDNPFYYIPDFSYNQETKIAEENGHLYVYQFFPAVYEGPVTYEDRYDGVILTVEDDSYKVSDFLYNIDPSELPGESEGEQKNQDQNRFQQLYTLMPILAETGIAPFSSGIKTGLWLLSNENGILYK